MASEPEASEIEITSLLETLVGNRDLSLFMPFLFGFTNNRSRDPDQESENPPDPDRGNENRIYLVNPFTQSMVVIEGSSSLESLLRDLGGIGKDGPPPASKAAIEALPSVEVMEEGECVICLDEWEIGAAAKQLPCKHIFHPNCIERWLGIHGSCPVCRHKMPVDDGDGNKNDVGGRGRGRRVREIWVGFSFGNDRRSDDSIPVPSTSTSSGSDLSSSPPPAADHQVVED